jgi:drug/metabolite transporter (DMT)-like permease
VNKGIAYMGLSVFFFAIMNVAIKYVDHLPTLELVLFRAIIAASIAFVTLKVKKINPWGNRKSLLLLRGLLGFCALSLFIASIQHMPMATALVLQYMSPVFVAILGVFILKERMRPIQWLYFAIAFAGVAMIKGFDERVQLFYLCMGIISCLFSAMAYTTIRYLKDSDDPMVVVFYFPFVTIPIAAALMGWNFLVPTGIDGFGWELPLARDWVWIVVMGVFAQLGQIFMTISLHLEKANIVSSMSYLGIVFGMGFGYFLFGEGYTILALLGIGLVLTGVLLNVFSRRT